MKLNEPQQARSNITTKVKVYKITPKGFNSCCEIDVGALEGWFTDAQSGDKFEIEIFEMPYEEYINLPEYMGP